MNRIILDEKEQKNGEVQLLVRETEMWLDEGLFNLGIIHLEDALEKIERLVSVSGLTRNSRGLACALYNIQECFLLLGYDFGDSISEFRMRVKINAYERKLELWRNALEKIQ